LTLDGWLVPAPGGGHRGLRERVGQEYDTRVMTFLARHLLSDAAGP
jgi:hypothetical protein